MEEEKLQAVLVINDLAAFPSIWQTKYFYMFAISKQFLPLP
jgi:hypothetical protein